MHEGALAQSALELVLETAKANGATRVTAIHLNVGVLAQVNADSLSFWLSSLAEGGPAEGAAIEVSEIAAEGECGNCTRRYPVEPPTWSAKCPTCGGPGELIVGRELAVSSIEVE